MIYFRDMGISLRLCLQYTEHSQMPLFLFIFISIRLHACICTSFAFVSSLATATFGQQLRDPTEINDANNKYTAFSSSCSPGNNGNTRTNTAKHPTAFLWAMAASNFLSRLLFSTLLVLSFILETGLGLEYQLFHRLLLHIIPFFLLPLYQPVSLFYHYCLNKHFLRFVPIRKKVKETRRSLCE